MIVLPSKSSEKIILEGFLCDGGAKVDTSCLNHEVCGFDPRPSYQMLKFVISFVIPNFFLNFAAQLNNKEI